MTETRKCGDWQRVKLVRKYLISQHFCTVNQHFCTVAHICLCSCHLRSYKPWTVQADHLHLPRAANFNTLTAILKCEPTMKNCRSLAWLRFINESRKPPRKKMKLPLPQTPKPERNLQLGENVSDSLNERIVQPVMLFSAKPSSLRLLLFVWNLHFTPVSLYFNALLLPVKFRPVMTESSVTSIISNFLEVCSRGRDLLKNYQIAF